MAGYAPCGQVCSQRREQYACSLSAVLTVKGSLQVRHRFLQASQSTASILILLSSLFGPRRTRFHRGWIFLIHVRVGESRAPGWLVDLSMGSSICSALPSLLVTCGSHAARSQKTRGSHRV